MVSIDGKGNGPCLVCVRNLDKIYTRGSEEIHVLQGLNLEVDAGDFVVVINAGKVANCSLVSRSTSPSTMKPRCTSVAAIGV